MGLKHSTRTRTNIHRHTQEQARITYVEEVLVLLGHLLLGSVLKLHLVEVALILPTRAPTILPAASPAVVSGLRGQKPKKAKTKGALSARGKIVGATCSPNREREV